LNDFCVAVKTFSSFSLATDKLADNIYVVVGGQHWVFQLGSFAFLMSGAVVLVLSDQELAMWRNILIIRALYGLGRGVFEGACRAVYAELFAGKDLSTAFSGQTLLAGLSGTKN
jgi:MFS family permease